MSFNTNRESCDTVGTVGDWVAGRYGGQRIILLQECQNWAPDFEVPGYDLVWSEGCYSAVLVPTAVAINLKETIHASRTCGALLGQTAVCSSYLPDCTKGLEAFSDAVEEMRTVLRRFRSRGARSFIVAGDFNVSFETDGDFAGPGAWGCDADGFEAALKREQLQIVLSSFGLVAVNTWMECPPERAFHKRGLHKTG